MLKKKEGNLNLRKISNGCKKINGARCSLISF